MRDVGLDGAVADHEALGDLGVRQPAREQLEHLALAGGELVEQRRRAGSCAGERRTNSSITERVTAGAMSASPRATTSMAASSSSGGASLSMKPLAPARSAS